MTDPDLAGILIMEAQQGYVKLDAYMEKQGLFADPDLAEAVVEVHKAAMLYLEAIQILTGMSLD